MTVEEYREGNKLLLLNTSLGRKFNYYMCYWAAPFIGILLIALFVLLFFRDHDSIFILLLGIYWCIIPILMARRSRKRYREQKLDREWQIDAHDAGLDVVIDDGNADSHYRWQALEKYLESDRLFVVLQNQMAFIPIPKRAFSSDQENEFRALLNAKLDGKNPDKISGVPIPS